MAKFLPNCTRRQGHLQLPVRTVCSLSHGESHERTPLPDEYEYKTTPQQGRRQLVCRHLGCYDPSLGGVQRAAVIVDEYSQATFVVGLNDASQKEMFNAVKQVVDTIKQQGHQRHARQGLGAYINHEEVTRREPVPVRAHVCRRRDRYYVHQRRPPYQPWSSRTSNSAST